MNQTPPTPEPPSAEALAAANDIRSNFTPPGYGVPSLQPIDIARIIDAAFAKRIAELERERDEARDLNNDLARNYTNAFHRAEKAEATGEALKKERDAAIAHLHANYQKLPSGLLEAVKEVTFRSALVEVGRDSLRDKLAALEAQLKHARSDGALLAGTREREAVLREQSNLDMPQP